MHVSLVFLGVGLSSLHLALKLSGCLGSYICTLSQIMNFDLDLVLIWAEHESRP